MLADAALGAGIAFAIAAVTTPVGVSGAVFLVPVQVSVLHTPSPAVTPTNLLYNLVAIPGALARFQGEGRLAGPLTRLLVIGTLPGVVIGAVIRVELLPGLDEFLLVIAAVMVPLGLWLAASRPERRSEPARIGTKAIGALSALVGAVGGVYGIGGGSILGPVLVGCGYSVREVAPAALAATFLTSVAGVAAYAVLSLTESGDIAPQWAVGAGLGAGGLAGSYLGARLQSRLPEGLLRRGLGLLALALGIRYALLALT